MRLWGQRVPAPVSEKVENPCPICTELRRYDYGYTIKSATHGAGGPDGSWHACYEHYRVANAIWWLVLKEDENFDFSLPLRPKDIDAWICKCSRCLEANQGIVTIMTICPECGSKRCPHAMDHRDPCSEDQN